MKRALCAICLLALLPSLVHCGLGGPSKAQLRRQNTITVPAGTKVPSLGLAFDLSYDSRTDFIIPGYRMLMVGITNESLKILEMKPLSDGWFVIDRKGRKRRAILNLRHRDPDAWANLPPRLKQLIEYPLMINLSETKTIDLIFPESVALNGFREVIFESASLGKIIKVYARETTR